MNLAKWHPPRRPFLVKQNGGTRRESAKSDRTVARDRKGAMDELTSGGDTSFGLLAPDTNENKLVSKLLEASRKAEAADPELRRHRERLHADLNAVASRRNGRNIYEAELQERLIRDARTYAESFLPGARSEEDRLKITRQIWNDLILNHPNRKALDFATFGCLARGAPSRLC
jgi:hypothetical protein